LLKSRREQDLEFWKEIATALVENKYNTKMSQNGYPITMYQGGLPHKLYFIAINNRGQVIISPNKKTVATYIIGELEILVSRLLTMNLTFIFVSYFIFSFSFLFLFFFYF